jgi:hypothetical protein
MAKKRTPGSQPETVTPERAARLLRLVMLVQAKPQTRSFLCRQLHEDVRSFYRDLDLLRSWGISLPLHDRRYELRMRTEAVYRRVPFPDPHLSLAEAIELAKGRTPAHRKLKKLLDRIVKEKRQKKK